MPNFCTNLREAAQTRFFPISCDLCKPVIIHLRNRPAPPSPDSGPPRDILNLADVADVLVANPVP